MKKLKNYFILSNISAIIGAVSLFSIMFLQKIQSESAYRIISVVIGSAFWLSILVSILSILKMNACQKLIKKTKKFQANHIGVISFMKTPAGKIADSVFIVSALIFVILLCKNVISSMKIIPFLSLMFLAFQMHCLYNGTNYCFLKDNMRDSEERKNNG